MVGETGYVRLQVTTCCRLQCCQYFSQNIGDIVIRKCNRRVRCVFDGGRRGDRVEVRVICLL